MFIIYILAVIGGIAIADTLIKMTAQFALQAEHEGDKVQYTIYGEDGKTPIWQSRVVDEFTNDETVEFKKFCKEWAKYSGAKAKWVRM